MELIHNILKFVMEKVNVLHTIPVNVVMDTLGLIAANFHVLEFLIPMKLVQKMANVLITISASVMSLVLD